MCSSDLREQPFHQHSESISSLALSKSRCHHSDHLLYSLIFLSIINWLSNLFAFLEYLFVFYIYMLLYACTTVIFLLELSSTIPLGVFSPYS